jgi:hypothetical protein
MKGQFSLEYSASRSGALELRLSTRSSLVTLRLRLFRGVVEGVDDDDEEDDEDDDDVGAFTGGLMIHCCGCCCCAWLPVEVAAGATRKERCAGDPGRGDVEGVVRGDERGEVENDEKHEQNVEPQLHWPSGPGV